MFLLITWRNWQNTSVYDSAEQFNKRFNRYAVSKIEAAMLVLYFTSNNKMANLQITNPKEYQLREKIRACGYNPDKLLELFEEELLYFAQEWTEAVLEIDKTRGKLCKCSNRNVDSSHEEDNRTHK